MKPLSVEMACLLGVQNEIQAGCCVTKKNKIKSLQKFLFVFVSENTSKVRTANNNQKWVLMMMYDLAIFFDPDVSNHELPNVFFVLFSLRDKVK